MTGPVINALSDMTRDSSERDEWVGVRKSAGMALRIILACVVMVVTASAHADITPAPIFGDHMVLQRDKPVPVWGTADAGAEVMVEFADQKKSTTADKDGKWRVTLDPMKASAEGRVLKIGGKEFPDVLVGEVWLTSGQSNMGWTLHDLNEPPQETDPLLRVGQAAKYGGVWFAPEKGNFRGPRNVGVGATPYYTAQELRRELNIPVGMIQASVGGSKIEAWIPEPDFRALMAAIPAIEEQMRGRKPDFGTCWTTRVADLIPFAIRGVLWYQGEFNCMDRVLYVSKQRKLIEAFRREWKDETLPFYYVQLPNGVAGIPASQIEAAVHQPIPGKSDGRALMWEAQRLCLAVPHTGMIVTIDLGDIDDGNHPRNKIDVGRRLSRLLLAKTYGRADLVATGPIYKSHEIKDAKVIVHFDYVGKGLMVGRKPYKDGRSQPEPVEEVKDGKLQHFAICGEDRVWYWAEAEIRGDTVVSWSDKVPKPVALRYAFSTWPTGANLYNRDGLPASPFRTDDWSGREERRNRPGQ